MTNKIVIFAVGAVVGFICAVIGITMGMGSEQERTITVATPPEDINSFAVKEVEWALSCDENYSDVCQSVFGYCGASDFPNKKYDTYTKCIVQEYRDFTSNYSYERK